jgi:hypothetical protein
MKHRRRHLDSSSKDGSGLADEWIEIAPMNTKRRESFSSTPMPASQSEEAAVSIGATKRKNLYTYDSYTEPPAAAVPPVQKEEAETKATESVYRQFGAAESLRIRLQPTAERDRLLQQSDDPFYCPFEINLTGTHFNHQILTGLMRLTFTAQPSFVAGEAAQRDSTMIHSTKSSSQQQQQLYHIDVPVLLQRLTKDQASDKLTRAQLPRYIQLSSKAALIEYDEREQRNAEKSIAEAREQRREMRKKLRRTMRNGGGGDDDDEQDDDDLNENERFEEELMDGIAKEHFSMPRLVLDPTSWGNGDDEHSVKIEQGLDAKLNAEQERKRYRHLLKVFGLFGASDHSIVSSLGMQSRELSRDRHAYMVFEKIEQDGFRDRWNSQAFQKKLEKWSRYDYASQMALGYSLLLGSGIIPQGFSLYNIFFHLPSSKEARGAAATLCVSPYPFLLHEPLSRGTRVGLQQEEASRRSMTVVSLNETDSAIMQPLNVSSAFQISEIASYSQLLRYLQFFGPPDMRRDTQYNNAIDIWYLGLAIWQLFDDHTPFIVPQDPAQLRQDICVRKLIPSKPQWLDEGTFFMHLSKCWEFGDVHRPSAEHLAVVFDRQSRLYQQQQRQMSYRLGASVVQQLNSELVGMPRRLLEQPVTTTTTTTTEKPKEEEEQKEEEEEQDRDDEEKTWTEQPVVETDQKEEEEEEKEGDQEVVEEEQEEEEEEEEEEQPYEENEHQQ